MTKFNVKYSVREVINGPGKHDDGVRDGDSSIVASGDVDKEGESAAAIRSELIAALEQGFPRHALGPTYDIDRTYAIEIVEVSS